MFKISAFLGALGLGLLLLSALPLSNPSAQPSLAPVAPATQSDIEYGKALLSAKGCVQCHRHTDIADSGRFWEAYGANGAPELTNYRADPAYLRRWLKDPSQVKPGTLMPTLGLSDAEIEALIAFLVANTPGQGSGVGG
jgi:cytochrome c